MKKHRSARKRLHFTPLITGIYGAVLGFGLMLQGLFERTEGIGIIRFLAGLGIMGFGFFGIWDGIRDWIPSRKKSETTLATQFIFTDLSGIKSSHVRPELLQKQIAALAEREDSKHFNIQILPSLPVGTYGKLKQVFCVSQSSESVLLLASFEVEFADSSYSMYQNYTKPETALEWFQQFLAGTPDFSGWEPVENEIPWEENGWVDITTQIEQQQERGKL